MSVVNSVDDVIEHVIQRHFVTGIVDTPTDWSIPLGDNWLLAWEVARNTERETGIDHQVVLREIHTRYFSCR